MNKHKQVSKLLVFAEVAKQKSFTGAGRELGISKSAVSQQVQLLESEIGVQLLHRTTRGLSLTAVGERMLIRCQSIQESVELAFTDLANIQNDPQGTFSVTCPHSLESNVVVPAINQLCKEYSGLTPELLVDDQSVDLVSNHLDAAIRLGDLEDSSYRALPLGKVSEVLCATPLYLQRSGYDAKLLKFNQLNKLSWISTSWQTQKMALLSRKTGDLEEADIKRFAKTNALPSALSMALHHMGVVLLPEIFARPYLNSNELVRIIPSHKGTDWPLYMVHNYHGEKPVHLVRFHELLKQLMANQAIHGGWVTRALIP